MSSYQIDIENFLANTRGLDHEHLLNILFFTQSYQARNWPAMEI